MQLLSINGIQLYINNAQSSETEATGIFPTIQNKAEAEIICLTARKNFIALIL